jgi:hypothetical protein
LAEKKSQLKQSSKVMSCRCLGVAEIQGKQPGMARAIVGVVFSWFKDIPVHLRNKGAEYQDQRYGKGMRLFNMRVKKGKHEGWTCTVCGAFKAV